MDPMKEATRLKRAAGHKKNDLYLSFYGNDRWAILVEIVLSMPARAYILGDRRGDGDSLQEHVGKIAGVHAQIDVTEKFMRGLSINRPDRIKVSLTHGLDEVIVLPAPRKKKKPGMGM